ncbi:unnamed protein product [Paramecium primaurelia]|uniref:Transmembrane protein n=1 Tax=Paramecium primaurelia TaxID=5886 RepID=A0A8S1QMQ5_PARPR|nr:unnamed protein product [Paramecium primaurelia]
MDVVDQLDQMNLENIFKFVHSLIIYVFHQLMILSMLFQFQQRYNIYRLTQKLVQKYNQQIILQIIDYVSNNQLIIDKKCIQINDNNQSCNTINNHFINNLYIQIIVLGQMIQVTMINQQDVKYLLMIQNVDVLKILKILDAHFIIQNVNTYHKINLFHILSIQINLHVLIINIYNVIGMVRCVIYFMIILWNMMSIINFQFQMVLLVFMKKNKQTFNYIIVIVNQINCMYINTRLILLIYSKLMFILLNYIIQKFNHVIQIILFNFKCVLKDGKCFPFSQIYLTFDYFEKNKS